MKTRIAASLAALCAAMLFTSIVAAKPAQQHHLVNETGEVDAVGDIDGTGPAPSKVLGDTIWVADWTFDAGGLEPPRFFRRPGYVSPATIAGAV